jgi:hypothetical protein
LEYMSRVALDGDLEHSENEKDSHE